MLYEIDACFGLSAKGREDAVLKGQRASSLQTMPISVPFPFHRYSYLSIGKDGLVEKGCRSICYYNNTPEFDHYPTGEELLAAYHALCEKNEKEILGAWEKYQASDLPAGRLGLEIYFDEMKENHPEILEIDKERYRQLNIKEKSIAEKDQPRRKEEEEEEKANTPIYDWIAAHGSERLKLLLKNNLGWKKIAKEEWRNANAPEGFLCFPPFALDHDEERLYPTLEELHELEYWKQKCVESPDSYAAVSLSWNVGGNKDDNCASLDLTLKYLDGSKIVVAKYYR